MLPGGFAPPGSLNPGPGVRGLKQGLALLVALLALAFPTLAEEAPRPLRTAAQRAVRLQATRNTRDLGGLPARGGYVRDGLVYRSGALCFLTEEDVRTVRGLALRTLVDLRRDSEIEKDGPDRPGLTRTVPTTVRLPMTNRRGNRALAYAGYLEGSPSEIRRFFEILAEGQHLPLLFHCSAGKDRTGILAALLLECLGTPRPVILDDYMQSVRNSPGLEVHPEWLQVVFQAVDRAGGIRRFLEVQGVPPELQEAVHRNLVHSDDP